MKKVLVIGAGGMLGSAVLMTLVQQKGLSLYGLARNHDVKKAYPDDIRESIHTGVDVQDEFALRNAMNSIQPDLVVNCVARNKVRPGENPILDMLPVNSLFPHILAGICNSKDIRLVHISTDGVFSGDKGMYKEDDMPDARDIYGVSKLLGEPIESDNVVTIRTSIIGHSLQKTSGLVDWFLSQEGQVKGFRNVFFSGLPTVELAHVIGKYLIPNDYLCGLYNIASKPISKYELLMLISDVYGKAIEIIASDEPVLDRSLDSEKFQYAVGYVTPAWPNLVAKMHASLV